MYWIERIDDTGARAVTHQDIVHITKQKIINDTTPVGSSSKMYMKRILAICEKHDMKSTYRIIKVESNVNSK